jgi:hypothetical protein
MPEKDDAPMEQRALPGLMPELDELDERLTRPPSAAILKAPAKTSKSYIRDGKHYSRVTAVIGLLDKSGPLTNWAASTQLEADYEAALVAFQVIQPGATMDDFKRAMRESLIETWGAAQRKPDWTEDRPRLAHAVTKDRAADVGTQAHGLLEWHIRKQVGAELPSPEEPIVTEEVRLLARAGWRFLKLLHFDPISVEETMALEHDEYGQLLEVAGTADLLAWVSIDEVTALRFGVPALPLGICVMDWKTSKGLYLEHKIQIAVYARMAQLCGLVDHLVPGLIVRLPREPGADAKICCVSPTDSELFWRVFKDLVRVYKATKPLYDADRREWYRQRKRDEANATAERERREQAWEETERNGQRGND